MRDDELRLLDCIAVPLFVLEVDDAGRPVYAAFNRTARDASGLSADDVIGKTAEDVYPGRFGEITYQRHVETLGRGVTRTYELTLPLAGSIRRVRTTLEPHRDQSGRIIRLVGTSADISTEQIIREAQTEADTITTEMEQFVSMAAHDLRSPMRRISYLADMLREDFQDLGDGKLEVIDKLEVVASKTAVLISDILSHAQATSAVPQQGTFDFDELCTDILATLDPMGQHAASFGGGHIEGDRTATQIILRNLIDNAFKHSGRDRVVLAIDLKDEGDGMFKVTIRDDGRGFDDPSIVFLDQGDFQPDSGFGLMGIRRLVLARGGMITARSPDDGRGAIIEFTLPGSVFDPAAARVASSARA